MDPNTDNQDNQSLVISYLTLRKAIGFLGLLLPVILVTGAWISNGRLSIEPSISDYYYTIMRNGFVGVLSAVGLFLYAYRGYGLTDRVAGLMGCVCALGVAFFPTSPDPVPDGYSEVTGILHFVFAGMFFATLIFFSLFLFTRTKNKHTMTERKKTRNTVYHICGYIMIACIVGIAVYFLWLENAYPAMANADVVFYFESLALVAFGVSWLVKGELILKDLNQQGSH
jgi:hypothetical protein